MSSDPRHYPPPKQENKNEASKAKWKNEASGSEKKDEGIGGERKNEGIPRYIEAAGEITNPAQALQFVPFVDKYFIGSSTRRWETPEVAEYMDAYLHYLEAIVHKITWKKESGVKEQFDSRSKSIRFVLRPDQLNGDMIEAAKTDLDVLTKLITGGEIEKQFKPAQGLKAMITKEASDKAGLNDTDRANLERILSKMVGPEGQSGIKSLKGDGPYQFELKFKGTRGDSRFFGNMVGGKIVFDHYDPHTH